MHITTITGCGTQSCCIAFTAQSALEQVVLNELRDKLDPQHTDDRLPDNKFILGRPFGPLLVRMDALFRPELQKLLKKQKKVKKTKRPSKKRTAQKKS